MRSVTVNGQKWSGFDPEKEWVKIPVPGEKKYTIIASY